MWTEEQQESVSGRLKVLEEFRLPDGRPATAVLLIPPVSGFVESAGGGELNGDEENRRSLRQRMAGRYATGSEDRYYLVVSGGKSVARAWYGYGFSAFPIANFGQVYTQPEFRKMGLAHRLMKWLSADLETGPVQAAFCSAGTVELAQFYAPYSFRPVIPGHLYGSLGWLRGGGAFDEFEDRYYRPAPVLERCPAAMRHRHEIDRLLDFCLQKTGVARCDRLPAAVPSLQRALFLREAGCPGAVDVFLAPGDRVVGWAFSLAAGPAGTTLSGGEIHPLYRASAIDCPLRREAALF